MEREGRPIMLSIDGRPPLVVKDEREYQLLWELVDLIETVAAVRESLKDLEEGRTLPLATVVRRLSKKHGISD
jgi:hypothetical protein